jgi:hypothetical protein
LDEAVEGSIKRFGLDFDNEEGSEEETTIRHDDIENHETLELNRRMSKRIGNKVKMNVMKDMARVWVQVIQI